jgi:uncharacterized protein (TIGR01777 family)
MTDSLKGKRILISGGSGLLGRAISSECLKQGLEVAWLSRDLHGPSPQGIQRFGWTPDALRIDSEALEWADIIINLAGKSIGETRWTRTGRREITESRIMAVKTLAEAMVRSGRKFHAFVGVSGAGFYGPGDTPFRETDPVGKGFPAEVAALWESAYSGIPQNLSEHFCILRLGVVLSSKGGAMPKIMQPIYWGVGAALGSGKQGFNWIHIEDAVRGFLAATQWNGTVNLSAPGKTSNLEATLAIAKAMRKKIFFPPVPAFLLEMALGERARLLTEGNYSDVSRISGLGFTFLHPGIGEASSHLISHQT